MQKKKENNVKIIIIFDGIIVFPIVILTIKTIDIAMQYSQFDEIEVFCC